MIHACCIETATAPRSNPLAAPPLLPNRPFTIAPLVHSSSPSTEASSVLFPQPVGPHTTIISPRFTVKEMPVSAALDNAAAQR